MFCWDDMSLTASTCAEHAGDVHQNNSSLLLTRNTYGWPSSINCLWCRVDVYKQWLVLQYELETFCNRFLIISHNICNERDSLVRSSGDENWKDFRNILVFFFCCSQKWKKYHGTETNFSLFFPRRKSLRNYMRHAWVGTRTIESMTLTDTF